MGARRRMHSGPRARYFRRKWNCAICGGPVILDIKTMTLSCKCGDAKYGSKYHPLISKEFVRIAKPPVMAQR